MVSATDHEAKVTVTQVGETKTHRLACDSCDWMETAGSAGAATRKKNSHIAEHRAATRGAEGVPTIMDAIEGDVEMPEGAFREVVPVVPASEDPVQVGEVIAHIRTGGIGDSFPFKPAGPEVGEEGVKLIEEISADLEGEEPREWTDLSEDVPEAEWTEPVNTTPNPNGWGAPKDEADRAKRLEHCPPHTRLEAEGYNADRELIMVGFCKECSNEIQDWVEWPCAYVAERQPPPSVPPLAVALTRSRIEAQAGPSDSDKDDPDSLWHAARAKAVSATLAAKLGSASDVAYIIEREVRERLNDARFRGNAYTRWGREREPFLEQVGLERYGIVGEDRLFHSRANPRHVCSPDGIAIHPETGKVALGEYKTSGKELTLAKAGANGYIDQIQWQMYVMEADWAVLIWERRLGEKADYDTYAPEVGGEHIIMRDQARIEELVRRADLFLDRLDHEQARMDEWTSSQGPGETVDRQLEYLVSQHLQAKQEVKDAEDALREYCEATGLKSVEMPGEWKLSYSFSKARSTFDKEAFEADNPGVYEKYLKEGAPPERATLRVTPVKVEAEE